ncbi:hypothetical protein QEN19_001160 [Hanseniaspora menglaensis]
MSLATLTINFKSPVVKYGDLVLARLINQIKSDSLSIVIVDDKAIKFQSELKLNDETTYLDNDVFVELAKFTEQKEFDLDLYNVANDKLTLKKFDVLNEELLKINNLLDLRTYIKDTAEFGLEDIFVWGILRSNGLMGSILKNKNYINLTRWYNNMELFPIVGEAHAFIQQECKLLKTTQKLKNAAEGKKKEGHKANFDIDLPGAKIGEVVTRFPPEPSGYLHIGHAKAALLNQYFANHFKGKLLIRFDDTNPSKEKEEYEQSIIEDLALMEIKGDSLSYTSDHFDLIYDYAIKMIKEGKAYCDDTDVETMREERGEGIKSRRRDRTVEENLRIFTEEMKNATEEGLKHCLRAKIDYEALNKTLRDPVIYRCNLTPHHRTGTQWKMYPTYDFCCPIVDSIEGVTHALRTTEYRDRNAQYDWMLEAMKLRKVHIYDFARVNFVKTLLSKRKLQWMVDENVVSNWDDPRFPTFKGVRRRGMSVKALRDFVISQGPSRNVINLEWNVIWALNKKVIDPIAPRNVCIQNPVVVEIEDGPTTPEIKQIAKHKKNPDVGLKDIVYSNKIIIEKDDIDALDASEEVTLMDWGNCIITKNADGSVTGKLNLEGDFKKTKFKLTWLAETADKTEVELVDFDHLITKDKIEEVDNWKDFINYDTEFHSFGTADLNIKNMKKGDILQFERKGYFILDKVPEKAGDKFVFFTIPDGKQVNRYGTKK